MFHGAVEEVGEVAASVVTGEVATGIRTVLGPTTGMLIATEVVVVVVLCVMAEVVTIAGEVTTLNEQSSIDDLQRLLVLLLRSRSVHPRRQRLG